MSTLETELLKDALVLLRHKETRTPEALRVIHDLFLTRLTEYLDANESNAEWVTRAKDKWHREGEVEIDDGATVSLSEDSNGIRGAYVQAWVWVES